MCARLKSNQGSARPKSADQPTEINTTAGRVIILELLVRASCSAVNERSTKTAIHTTAGVLPKYCRARAVNVLAASNFCSCAQFLIILPPTNYIALIGAHRSKKSAARCAHNSIADESYLFSSFLLPSLQIVVDESGNPVYNFWLQSNCLLAFEWLGFILSH